MIKHVKYVKWWLIKYCNSWTKNTKIQLLWSNTSVHDKHQ